MVIRRPVPKKALGTRRTRTGKISRIQEEHSSFVWKRILFIIFLAVTIVVGAGVIITMGPLPLTVYEVYGTLINHFIPGYFFVSDQMDTVIWLIRMPRMVGAIIVGIGLAVCGCAMQAVLKNPLASPFTLGITSGAQFGISLAVVLGLTIFGGPYLYIGNAFIFALLCSGVIIGLSFLKGATSETMVLAGIAINYLFGSLTTLLSYMATSEQHNQLSSWGMGSVSDLTWNNIGILVVASCICLPLLYSKAWDLNLMTVGDESAKSMGVNANRVRIFIMAVTSFLVAVMVAFVGVIGFIGLVAPHIGRMIVGTDHRFLIPATGGIGAVLLLFSVAVSTNLLSPIVLPVGTVMSIIGVPFFLYLILRGRRKEYWS